MAVVGGGGVNPFLSDSEESEPEETRPGGSNSSDPGGSGAPLPVSSSTSSSPPLQQQLLPPPAQAEEPPRVPVDALAAQLLRDQFVLTALELHTELLESGRELPRLRDYFSNPGNFERQSGGGAGALAPTPSASVAPGLISMVGGGKEPGAGQLHRAGSISTLDSLDFARYSDDGNRETDERVAEQVVTVPNEILSCIRTKQNVQSEDQEGGKDSTLEEQLQKRTSQLVAKKRQRNHDHWIPIIMVIMVTALVSYLSNFTP